jgi:hypothetical protein
MVMTMHVLMVVAAASSNMRSEATLAIETSAKLRRKQQNRNAYAMPILPKEPCAILIAFLARRHFGDVKRHEFVS